MSVPYEHVKQVCKIGQRADCCAYIMYGGDGWLCGKTDAGLVEQVKERLPQMSAQGDNCDGWFEDD